MKNAGQSHTKAEHSWIELRSHEILLRLRVQPRAGSRGVVGVFDGRLKLRVTEAPADGQANLAVIRLVARLARVPRSAVIMSQGATAREKTLRISTKEPEATANRLVAALGDSQEGG